MKPVGIAIMGLAVSLAALAWQPAGAQAQKAGDGFKDCADVCPDMIVVPRGRFIMGSPTTEKGHFADEDVHTVTIGYAFAVGKYDVTFAEWDACVDAGGCNGYKPNDRGWGRGNMPAINVSWEDAQAYVKWLSQKTGKPYRLLSEAEWEYAARAGTQTAYYWGDAAGSGNANCKGCGSQWDNKQSSPSGAFKPNGFGLYDMTGNVWQWTLDCYNDEYSETPTNGSPYTAKGCDRRVRRGGGFSSVPRYNRSGTRYERITSYREDALGFRVARTL